MYEDILFFLRADHGWLFWAAVAAMAAGVSLVLAGITWQLRCWWRNQGGLGRGGAAATRSEKAAALHPPVRSEAARKAYAANPLPSRESTAAPALAPSVTTTSLTQLLGRLQQAVADLEGMASEAWAPPPDGEESFLKQGDGQVEYVFRASRL